MQVCGNGGHCVTLWSLPGLDCVTRICMRATPQAVTIANDQVLFAHQPTVAIDDSSYHFVNLLSMVSGIRSGSVGCRPWLLLNLLQLEIVFHVAVCT